MYNYDFMDEATEFEQTDTVIEIDSKLLTCNLLITNKNILLFQDINKNNVLKGRGVCLPQNNELFLKIPLDNLEYKVIDNNTYIKFNNKVIIIHKIMLNNF